MTTTTTTTTTPRIPPLPAEFEAVLPKAGGTMCDELKKAGMFDAKWAAFYRWMFNDDGTFSDEFKRKLCNEVSCLASGTDTTTSGTGTTTTTTTGTKLTWSSSKVVAKATGCCISDDGQTIGVCCDGDQIQVSTDAGATWTAVAASHAWRGICCSSDGTTMYACIFNGSIYGSTDSGTTWAEVSAETANWQKVKCNGDGSIVIAAGYKAVASNFAPYFWRSTDSGATWAASTTSVIFSTTPPAMSLTMCNNGNVALAGYCNFAFLTLDQGAHFNSVPGMFGRTTSITSVASNSNGTVFYLIGDMFLFKSTDGTATWSVLDGLAQNWLVNSSADGLRVLLACPGRMLRESFDGCNSFVSEDAARVWTDIAQNPDGTKAVAVATTGGVYTGV